MYLGRDGQGEPIQVGRFFKGGASARPRPSRGRRGKSFRCMVAVIPTARFRDRLVQMATNASLSVIAVDPAYSRGPGLQPWTRPTAVDPAYTSRWGPEHWLGSLQKISVDASGHHAAALVIARRGFGQRARQQRRRCDSTPAEHGEERATRPVVLPVVAGQPAVLSPSSEEGIPEPARPEGSRTCGVRPDRPNGGWRCSGGNGAIRSEAGYDQLETYRQLAMVVTKFGLSSDHPAVASAAKFLRPFQTKGPVSDLWVALAVCRLLRHSLGPAAILAGSSD
jgi:hypothetical protein